MNEVLRTNKRGLYADGGGLYLRVGPTGAKSWIFRYRRDGKLVDMGLGSINTFNLADARDRARVLRQQVDDARRGNGPFPLEARRKAQEAARLERDRSRTFRQCAEEYWLTRKWASERSPKLWLASMQQHVYPKIGAVPVKDIDKTAV